MKNCLKFKENEFGQKIGLPVPLNIQPEHRFDMLQGRSVRLLPFSAQTLNAARLQQLWERVCTEPDARCWTYLPYPPMSSADALNDALQRAFDFHNATHYVIEADGRAVGWTALLNIQRAHGTAEIGNVYFSHQLKQSRAATETIYLLLRACFSAGYRRIEWKCDDLNEPSKRAALRFGFHYEGLFRQHYIVKGRSRNTAWFSMLDEEWPELDNPYQAWLNADNFDAAGRQKRRLQDFIQQPQKK